MSDQKKETTHEDILKAVHSIGADVRLVDSKVTTLAQSLERNWTATDEHGRQLIAINTQHDIEERQRQQQTLRETQAVRQEAASHHSHVESGIVIPESLLKIAALAATALLVLVFVVASLAGVNIPLIGS